MTLSPGGPATSADLELAKEVRQLFETELERVRKAAEGWRNGLAALFALVAGASVVKGEDVIADLDRSSGIAVGILTLLAVLSAALGAFEAMRAAFGLPDLAPANSVTMRRREESKKAREHLHWAILLTFGSVLLTASAVGVVWYAQEEPAGFVKVATDSTEVCGKVKRADGELLTLEAGGLERDIVFSDVRSLQVVKECS